MLHADWNLPKYWDIRAMNRLERYNDFFGGNCYDAYNLFGAHVEDNGVRFTVWAPNALSIKVVGEFNGWSGDDWLEKIDDRGVWSLFKDNVSLWSMYKYEVEGYDHKIREKADPFAFYSEKRPGVGSKVVDLDFRWTDQKFIEKREKNYDKAMSIYEVHAGSWKWNDEKTYTYDELTDNLIPYCVEHGFTHIEFMPLSEYPFDGSWGYQSSGYFSVTSRYGSHTQLMNFVDKAHQNNIGIIMDFVPCHFVKDSFGLCRFDGTAQYEPKKKSDAESQWGTYNFNFDNEPVKSFLMSAAAFWIDRYHVDGIRMDAVSNLIYPNGDSSKKEREGSINFMKRLNYGLNQLFPGILTIAEDSTDYAKVTARTEDGGLGFDYKWDLGWMNDTLNYYAMDPIYRKYHHHDLTFSMAYFYSERFLLPFSHDEVVHGKKTIVDKMWGEYGIKFAQARNLYTYMFTHPGKKLNFMGNEIAHIREWHEDEETDWFLLKYPIHDAFYRCFHDLNQIYVNHSCLYRNDYNGYGFRWIDADNTEASVYSYIREDEKSMMVVVLNMLPVSYERFELDVPYKGIYTEIFNSDKDIYNGYNMCNYKPLKTVHKKGRDILRIRLAPYAGVMFEIEKQTTAQLGEK